MNRNFSQKFFPSSKKIFFSALIFSLTNTGSAFAAGYSTELYSTSGLANSYAGSAAGSHDASDMFFNPAILSGIQKKELIASVSYLDLKVDVDNARGNFSNTAPNSGSDVTNAGTGTFVPAFYFAAPINDEFAFGLAVTTPFGLVTKYDLDWVGRYRAVESVVSTTNFNPSLSYKINNQLSVGAGVVAQYYEATLTNAVVNGADPYNPSSDFIGKAKGSDWGYGYTLGATFKLNEKLKFGLGYRSKIEHKLTGTTQVAGYGWRSDFSARTATPESLTAGVAFKLNKEVELVYDTTWTRWSRLKNLTIDATQNNNLDTTTHFNWHDSFLHSVGANFTLNNKWLARIGAAYEKDAVTNANREPRAPNGDKIWTSIGFNYKIKNGFSVDGTYLHQIGRTATVGLNDATTTNNSLSAKYKVRTDVFSVALKKEF